MKLIVKDTTNELLLTLTELVSIERPFFLFGIRDEQAGSWSYLILGTDQSPSPNKYNLFEFNEPALHEFKAPGFYSYRVWERNSNTIPVGFDPETKQGLLESGRIKVKAATETEIIAFDTDNEITVYNG